MCMNFAFYMTQKVFGTILVGDLKERHNNTFFGSGETVLFSLKPNTVSYTWTAESDLILRANDEEIIAGSGGGLDYLTVHVMYMYYINVIMVHINLMSYL